ncbi:hypothetical protein J6590_081567 [Homalodisca vitripennis]|nr:hypothetical protein J6590_081567 [Homalodisca vitripennis]
MEGDRHTVTGLLSKQVAPTTIVREFCKPGAKLFEVMTTICPPSDCLVLISGNYRATGNSDISVATWRSGFYLHSQAMFLNACIEELAVRHNSQVLDLNKISPRYFTRHDFHLTMKGKWLLVKLIEETLSKEDTRRLTELAVNALLSQHKMGGD